MKKNYYYLLLFIILVVINSFGVSGEYLGINNTATWTAEHNDADIRLIHDNNTSSIYSGGTTFGVDPNQWIHVDLLSNKNLTQLEIYSFAGRTLTYNASYSLDNSTWYTWYSSCASTGGGYFNCGINSSGFVARYLKFVTIANSCGAGCGFDVYEMRITGENITYIYNFLINATNLYNNSSINTFNVTMINGNGSVYSFGTITGSINTSILETSSYLWNISVFGTNVTWNASYTNYNLSNDLQANLSQFPILNATNTWNSSVLTDWNVTIDGVTYATSTSYIYIPLNTSFFAYAESVNHISQNKSLGLSQNSAYNFGLVQSQINFSCFEKISSNQLVCVNQTIYPNANTYNFTISVGGYYDVTTNNTLISAYDNTTINVSGFFSSNLSLNSVSVFGYSLSSCVYNVSSLNYSWSESVTGTPNASIGLINGSYEVSALCNNSGYSYLNISINASVHSLNFSIYPYNSLFIYFYNDSSNAVINSSVVSLVNDGVFQISNTTSNGLAIFSNLSVANHSLSFFATGFENKYYLYEVLNNSVNNLSIFLLPSTSNSVTFTVKDSDTGETIEGVIIVVSKWINNSKFVVENYVSDVTGKFIQSYSDGARYDYNISFVNYDEKYFSLNPIQSATYTILLDKSISYTSDIDYSNVVVYWSPKRFEENSNPNISFTFEDANGDLESYGFNATYNGVSLVMSGTSAGGETLIDNLTIGDAGVLSYINIVYYYKKTYGDTHSFNLQYFVYNASSLTWANNFNEDWGFGEFDKTLIAVLIILTLAGSGAMFLGGTGAGVMGIVGFGLVIKLGLMNPYLAYPSLIILVLIVGWRASL